MGALPVPAIGRSSREIQLHYLLTESHLRWYYLHNRACSRALQKAASMHKHDETRSVHATA